MTNPANTLVNADGTINTRSVMQMAHAIAARANREYKEFAARQVRHAQPAISYAWHFADALRAAWARVVAMKINMGFA